MSNTIRDVTENAKVIMLVGSNPEEAHPVIGMQIRAAIERGCRLIVVDPRDIGLSKMADIHIKLRPGTNVAFANMVMHVLIRENLIDKDFIAKRTEGFETLVESVKDCTPEWAAKICGVDKDDLISAAKMFGSAERASIMYCLGVTEHSTGTDGVMALSNIVMATGNIGKPGGGMNPLRGQNNVQGACDMGASPDEYTGYQKVWNDEARQKFEKAWGVPLRAERGTKATECFPAMIDGRIKGLYIFGEDPMRTDPDTNHVIKALNALDFFVVQDLFLTETAKRADVVLPGASYAEKEGTFTNTERRVQRVRKAVEVREGARLDTDIFIDVMNRMGYPQPQVSAAEIMDEIASLTPSYAGMSHKRLDTDAAETGLQWPCTGPDHPGTPILHVNQFTRGLGAFASPAYQPSAERPDESYPFVLTTGRILYHYNAQAMTSRTPGLDKIQGRSFIEINTEDAKRLGISEGDLVEVSSRRGRIQTSARVSHKTNPGQVWMPFHFQDGNSNWLTNAALDSVAKAPEYKVCAVQISAVHPTL